MLVLTKCLLFVLGLRIGESAFVDTLHKCDVNDKACLSKVIQGVIVSIGKTGIPEYDIPAIDPLHVDSLNINLLNIMDLKVSDVTVKGLKNCVVNDVLLDMKKGHVTLTVVCDVSVKAKYEITGGSPSLKEIFGGSSVRGNGNAKLKAEKLLVKFDYRFDTVRREDGEVYIECKKDLAKYSYNLLGGSKLAIDKIYIGDVESSDLVVNYFNSNSQGIWKEFGKIFLDEAMEIAHDLIHRFFGSVPTKNYLAGDLSQYIKQ
ncbi:uncharacterized protein LOC126975249 [Leptidea sinapis]|uniref:uncharacterized protein LOC126975249 n=1 Tax=Leptidea sinapis TaxID=189913 RepID=UPI0021306572|nr:uncharacterized protein LOC126975249 [Leptidea sinapis]